MSDHNPETDELTRIEATNRERLRGWFDAAGIEEAYPLKTDDVVRLLRAVGYAASNDVLLESTANEWVPPVPRVAGRLAWDATSIVTVASAMEFRRMWQPLHPLHAHKATLSERIVQVAEREGGVGINDIADFDWEGLLGVLVQVAGDRGATESMAEAFRAKLKSEGIL